MEAGILLRPTPLELNSIKRHHHPPPKLNFLLYFSPRSVTVTATLNSHEDYRGPTPRKEWVADWVSKNDDFARSLPIYVGGLSLLAVLFNRTVSGIAPVADASSSQSRADLLTLGLAVTSILNGLVWLSIRPKSISAVNPEGVDCQRICSPLPDIIVAELHWLWESLSDITCCVSLVIVYEKRCIMQVGFAAASSSNPDVAIEVNVDKLMKGSLCQGILRSKSQSYLANLSLYPAKSELPFLPSNTQAVILQPVGDSGVAIIGGDTIRGFTTSDQAWISLVGQKLDATLAKMSNIPVPQETNGKLN